MHLRLVGLACFLLIGLGTSASIRIDSVGVENVAGKKVILHRVEPQETCYSIARKYRIDPKPIAEVYGQSPLTIGAVLKISTPFPFYAAVDLTDYIVAPKETLYGIAKKAGMTVTELKELNQLKEDQVAVGAILKIRNKPALKKIEVGPLSSSERKEVRVIESEPSNGERDTLNNNRFKFPLSRYGLYETQERGIAMWISDENLDKTQMLALHQTAPIGTVIKITNPMTNRSAFAKVVGKFVENESTKDVIVILTKAVADALGALDKKFQVSLMYGIPKE